MNKNTSKKQLLDKALLLHSRGNIKEAAKYYQYFIDQGFKDCRVFSNYGTKLNDSGKLTDAVINIRKAIK
tara:strand:- start:605 stop:814 length:210 start_codon:yes stop_codon:yes gene_type:complete